MRKAMEKKKLRGSPASEEFALLYIQDTTNSENFKAYIFPQIKKSNILSVISSFFLFY